MTLQNGYMPLICRCLYTKLKFGLTGLAMRFCGSEAKNKFKQYFVGIIGRRLESAVIEIFLIIES